MMDHPGVQQFLKDLRVDCRALGIKLCLKPSMQVIVHPGVKVGGFLCMERKLLVVAKNSIYWLANLVHESSHLDQWIEDSDLWAKDEEHGTDALQQWLDGKEIGNIGRAITNIINLELDCEKRALKKITKYDLPINTATYIQRANEYLLSYRLIQKHRVWNNNYSELFHLMPTRFMSDSYYKKLTPKMEKIFKQAA